MHWPIQQDSTLPWIGVMLGGGTPIGCDGNVSPFPDAKPGYFTKFKRQGWVGGFAETHRGPKSLQLSHHTGLIWGWWWGRGLGRRRAVDQGIGEGWGGRSAKSACGNQVFLDNYKKVCFWKSTLWSQVRLKTNEIIKWMIHFMLHFMIASALENYWNHKVEYLEEEK